MSEHRLPEGASFGTTASRVPVLPVMALACWWCICFGFYFTRWPISYVQTNFNLVCIMFLSSLIAMVLGERLGSRIEVSCSTTDRQETNKRIPLIGLAILIALFIPMTRAYSAYGLGSLTDALGNQTDAYNQTTQLIVEGSTSRQWLVILQTLAAPLTLTALPYFALTWFQSRQNGRYFLSALALPLVLSMLTGRDQQLGMMVLLTAAGWMLAKARGSAPVSLREILGVCLTAAAVLVVIAERKSDRMGGRIPCGPGTDNCVLGISHGTLWEFITHTVSSYASQGFEGLGRAFDGTWHFGGGFSHAPALALFLGNEGRTTVTSQLDLNGWASTGYWSTAFTGIANDVPWALVPVVIGIQAYILGKSWRSAAQLGDPLSTTVAALTWVSLFFAPQNLQLALSGPTYVGYLVLIFIFLFRSNAWKRAGRSKSSSLPGHSPRATPIRT